jgi:hypothetical protein
MNALCGAKGLVSFSDLKRDGKIDRAEVCNKTDSHNVNCWAKRKRAPGRFRCQDRKAVVPDRKTGPGQPPTRRSRR